MLILLKMPSMTLRSPLSGNALNKADSNSNSSSSSSSKSSIVVVVSQSCYPNSHILRSYAAKMSRLTGLHCTEQ